MKPKEAPKAEHRMAALLKGDATPDSDWITHTEEGEEDLWKDAQESEATTAASGANVGRIQAISAAVALDDASALRDLRALADRRRGARSDEKEASW